MENILRNKEVELQCLLYSHKMFKEGINPWHIDSLENELERNNSCFIDDSENYWSILFIGTGQECVEYKEKIIQRKYGAPHKRPVLKNVPFNSFNAEIK